MLTEAILTGRVRRHIRRALALTPDAGPPPAAPPAPEDAEPRLLYLHVPFCEELCPYCSFNRSRLDRGVALRYFRALETEIRLYREMGFLFDALYIGGGTPTILPDELESAVDRVKSFWPIRSISLETNPNHLTPERVRALRSLGVRRLSVGIQSFDDGVLERIGRYGKYGSGRELRKRLSGLTGVFETLNVDMIFNFPFQTEAMLRRDLEILRQLRVDQVTFYPLMAGGEIRRQLARWGKPGAGRERRYYRKIRSALLGEYRPSSAWCFSRRDGTGGGRGLIDEYIVERREYAGLGSGSFGYVRGTVFANTFDVHRYIELLERGRLPVVLARKFSERDRIVYDCLMRLFGGRLLLEDLNRRYGRDILTVIRPELLLLRLIGAVRLRGAGPGGAPVVELTERGSYFWVAFMREFFTGVTTLREACRAAISENIHD